MSQGKAMPLAAAREVATELRDILAPACRRISIVERRRIAKDRRR